ncbi:DUF2795 domain-containing protein [Modestobacter sp. VKM Ac-2986]|uniref:DUF2795 domain-containing protein n=1 Tax=Modestobacter sp. VKM Ac-2986 TaxID=3004140 RepID=UPI0022AA2977|nr:DUF2795 domain-containing protein [Modestobacter sp. VKM Ac-2986]MCZ2827847.1 DUF2795 domain-containing protein [Modestobacter sp. VKM Ac-2986]
MSENDDTFAGTSARSTTHSARQDDLLKHEVEGMMRSGRSTHAEEWKDPEPAAEGEPDVDSSPADTLLGGVPVGMTPDAVVARAELARWLVRADFPATGPELVEAARDHRAPDAVADELARLPDGETYERIGDVVRALGYPTET